MLKRGVYEFVVGKRADKGSVRQHVKFVAARLRHRYILIITLW